MSRRGIIAQNKVILLYLADAHQFGQPTVVSEKYLVAQTELDEDALRAGLNALQDIALIKYLVCHNQVVRCVLSVPMDGAT